MKSLGLSSAEKTLLLAESGVFVVLDDNQLAALSAFSEGYAYEEGETVFERGSVAREMYIVESGEVSICQDDEEIARYVDGETFGEMDLLGQAGRTATARLVSPGVLLVFPRKDRTFQSILQSEPQIAATVMHSLLSLVAGRIRVANRVLSENSPWIRKLRAEMFTDKLTGLFSRSFIDEELPGMVDSASELCVVMVKPDNFKDINDTYGHAVGDAVLSRMAEAFRSCLNEADLGIRYLGNEFAAVFPHAAPEECRDRAARIHAAMNGLDLSGVLPDGRVRLTFSTAFACAPVDANPIDEAHERLFDVRKNGPAILYTARESSI